MLLVVVKKPPSHKVIVSLRELKKETKKKGVVKLQKRPIVVVKKYNNTIKDSFQKQSVGQLHPFLILGELKLENLVHFKMGLGWTFYIACGWLLGFKGFLTEYAFLSAYSVVSSCLIRELSKA